MKQFLAVAKIFLCALALVQLSACSTIKRLKNIKSDPVAKNRPVLTRGWAFIEDQKSLNNRETGVPQLNFVGAQIVGKQLIAGSDRFGIFVLDKKSGRIFSQIKLDSDLSSDFIVRDGVVYFGTMDSKFNAVNIDTGKLLWSTDFLFPAVGRGVFAQGRIFQCAQDNSCVAMDPSTGKILWSYKRRSNNRNSIWGGGNLNYFDKLIWVGFSDGGLLGLEPQTGSVKFQKQFTDNLKFTDLDAKPVKFRNGMIVTTYDGKTRYIRRDGSTQWAFAAGSVRAPLVSALNNGTVYLSGSDGFMYAISSTSGDLIWKFRVPNGNPTSAKILSKKGMHTLVFATTESKVYALDANTGKKVSEVGLGHSSGSLGALVSDQEKQQFFLSSKFGRIYQFKLQRSL